MRLERARFWRAAAAACLTALTLPDPARAAEPEAAGATASRAVTLNEDGARYYAARDYRRAVEKFIQAYATDNDPNLLFNIASCYEGLGDLDAAVEKYREFLAAPGAEPSGRPHAEAVIARWEQTHSGNAGTASIAAPPVVEPAPAPAAEARPTAVAEKDEAGSWLPWVVVGGGSVIAVLGGASYMLGARDHAEVTDADGYGDPTTVSPMTRAEADELVDSGRVKKQMGAAGLAVGSAMVASYLVWLLFDDPDASEPSPSFTPTASGATLTLEGKF